MRRVVFLAIVAMLGIQLASAVVCPTDTLTNYLTNFGSTTGCTIGALTFQQFSNPQIASSGSVATAWGADSNFSGITITPLTDANGAGFMVSHTPAVSVNSGGHSDLELSFIVKSATASIDSLYTEINGSATAGGEVHLTEVYCLNGTTLPPDQTCPGNAGHAAQTLERSLHAGQTDVPNTFSFSPVSSLAVLKDMDVRGNNPTAGTATDSFVKDQFGPPVPEPSLLYVTAGMFAILWPAAAARRRRLKNTQRSGM